MSLSDIWSKALDFLDENSPTVLTVVAVGGLVTTAVLAARAAVKSRKDLEDCKDEYLDLLDELDDEDAGPVKKVVKKVGFIFKRVWRRWIPFTLAFIATVSCVIGSNVISERRLASISAAYALSESKLLDYKEAAKEVVGEKAEKKIQNKVYEKKIEELSSNPDELTYYTGRGNTLMFDPYCNRIFLSDVQDVYEAIQRCNRLLGGGIYLSLNEVYDELGLGETILGSEYGWISGQEIKLKDPYDICSPNGGPQYFVLEFATPPQHGFRERGYR